MVVTTDAGPAPVPHVMLREDEPMSCEHLVCASCAGPVVEGRCPVCRAARADVHAHLPFGLTPQLIAVIAAVTVVVLLLVAHAQ